jgi:hypothetical protein
MVHYNFKEILDSQIMGLVARKLVRLGGYLLKLSFTLLGAGRVGKIAFLQPAPSQAGPLC